MENQNLYFNALTFSHPTDKLTLYFSDQEKEGYQRLFHTLVPDEVKEQFGEQEHYYTSFDKPIEDGLKVTKLTSPSMKEITTEDGEKKNIPIDNTAFSISVLKRYYYHQIQKYFKSLGLLVMPNFVNAIELWIPLDKPSPSYYLYERFTLKIEFRKVTRHLELIVSYQGTSKVFKKSVSELQQLDVAPENFTWVVCNNNIYRYDEMPNDLLRDKTKIYPKWNFDIRNALNEKPKAPERGNKYEKFKNKIDFFISNYLSNKDFQNIIPLHSLNLVKVNSSIIGNVQSRSNELLFGGNRQNRSPYFGISKYGPYDTPAEVKLHFFFIYHKPDKQKVANLQHYLDQKLEVQYQAYDQIRTATFKGLRGFAHLDPYYESGTSFSFENYENPLPEIKAKLEELNLPSDRQYMAIYLSPYDKYSSSKKHRSFYFKIKEHLLKKGISSQVILSKNVEESVNFTYSLNNIAVAIIAKLNGIPWKLETKEKKELVVGIGAYKHKDINVQYIGSAFSFQNTGELTYLDCYRKDQTEELAGSILQSVKDFRAYNKDIKRLIIHFYKKMSKDEIKPIEEGLKELNLDIPVYILTINKTESKELIAFDTDHKDLLPESGKFISITHNEFILFNNTRYNSNDIRSSDGYPFPIKIRIDCTQKEKINSFNTKKELIDQVYQFSRMYWKSVRQQNLPVTVKYPEMVAEMFPYFEGNQIPEFGKDKLWFL